MRKLLGKTVCAILRKHKWRRRIKEYVSDGQHPVEAHYHTVCARCGQTRQIKRRVPK